MRIFVCALALFVVSASPAFAFLGELSWCINPNCAVPSNNPNRA